MNYFACSGFAALAAWHWRAAKRTANAAPPAATPSGIVQQAGAMIAAAGGRVLTEREAKAVLALYGVPVVGERVAQSADEAVNAAGSVIATVPPAPERRRRQSYR